MLPALSVLAGAAFLGALAGVFASRALSAYLVALAFKRARRKFEAPTVTPAGNLHDALARVCVEGEGNTITGDKP